MLNWWARLVEEKGGGKTKGVVQATKHDAPNTVEAVSYEISYFFGNLEFPGDCRSLKTLEI